MKTLRESFSARLSQQQLAKIYKGTVAVPASMKRCPQNALDPFIGGGKYVEKGYSLPESDPLSLSLFGNVDVEKKSLLQHFSKVYYVVNLITATAVPHK